MFLEKLWLRIKGELILIREDLGAGRDIREKAELLLQKLENRLGFLTGAEKAQADRLDTSQGGSSEKETQAEQSFREIEQEWQDLVKLREKEQRKSEGDKATPPNPRTLG
jgi:hypothetical protein